METLHRIAGVSDVSEKPLPPPPPIPQDDLSEHQLSRRASRASLPRDLQRQPSRKSLRSTPKRSMEPSSPGERPLPMTPKDGDTQTPASHVPPQPISKESEPEAPGRPSNVSVATSDEFAWGPSHPCFPHPNPHCAPESTEFLLTRVIRVKRDWLTSGDLYPQYANLYPEILDPLVSDTDFRFLVTNINTRLQAMFSPWETRAWTDAILSALTGYLWDDAGLTGVKRGIKDLETYIDRWNEKKASEGLDVRIVQLRRTGFTSLDFVVPDPGIDAVEESPIGPAE